MVWSEIALICVSIVLVLVVIAWVCVALKQKDNAKNNRVDDIYIKYGIRYTKRGEVLDKDGKVKVSLNKGDILLERGKEYKVGEKGDLLAGKYTVLSADENLDSVNIRVGGLVREFKHFSSIVLTEGDTISAVSANVILR